MKTILLIIALLSGIKGSAQTPQYYADYHPSGANSLPSAAIAFYNANQIVQNLYPRDSFKGGATKPPYGKIKNVYLRSCDFLSSYCKQYGVKISLGYSNLPYVDTVKTIFKNLSLVATADSIELDTAAIWVKIPLSPEASFYFDTVQNLVMQLQVGDPQTYCWYMRSNYAIACKHSFVISGISNIDSGGVEPTCSLLDFGFDLYPTGVEDISGVTDVQLYPNPAQNVCMVSFEAKAAIKNGMIVVRNVTGKEVITERYENISGRFSKELDVSGLPRGVYFAEIRADGERVMRKLVVQ